MTFLSLLVRLKHQTTRARGCDLAYTRSDQQVLYKRPFLRDILALLLQESRRSDANQALKTNRQANQLLRERPEPLGTIRVQRIWHIAMKGHLGTLALLIIGSRFLEVFEIVTANTLQFVTDRSPH
jgi:hypothetical protein